MSWTTINQPIDGRYTIEIDNLTDQSEFKIFAYDQQAKVQTFIPEKNNLSSQKIIVDWQKNGDSQFTTAFSWQNFLIELNQLDKQQLIDQPVYQRLMKLANYAKQADQVTWPRYKNYLKNILQLAKNNQNEEKITELLLLLD
jgi:hypothetical protein